jgi:hypothetical protein
MGQVFSYLGCAKVVMSHATGCELVNLRLENRLPGPMHSYMWTLLLQRHDVRRS